MYKLTISIIYISLVVLQIVLNNKKYYKNRDKRRDLSDLEFIQMILNMYVNNKFVLSKDLKK